MKSRLSNWKEESDLYEVVTGKMTDKEALKKVDEKKGINNKVIINPKLSEAMEELGGEVISVDEALAPSKQELNIMRKVNLLQLRLQKEKKKTTQKAEQAAKQQEDIPVQQEEVGISSSAAMEKARKEAELKAKEEAAVKKAKKVKEEFEAAVEYFYEQGINEEGIDLIIEEVGLEDFVDFVDFVHDETIFLNEERKARKMNVRTLKSTQKKAEEIKASTKDVVKKAGPKDVLSRARTERALKKRKLAKPAAKKEAPAPVKKAAAAVKSARKATVAKARKDFDGDGKKETPKQEHRGVRNKKITKAVAKAKPAQPKKPASKEGLRAKIKSAYEAGVKRHRKATQPVRVFHKGMKAGAKKAVKFAKDVKKVVSEEVVDEKFATQYKDKGKLSKTDAPGSRHDHTHDVDPRMADYVPKGKVRKSSKAETRSNVLKFDMKKEGFSNWRNDLVEKDLSAAERRALPNKDFALPGKGEGPQGKQAGSYPIPDEKHARSALSLVSQHGTPEEKAKVRAKVKKKFPNIEVSEGKLTSIKATTYGMPPKERKELIDAERKRLGVKPKPTVKEAKVDTGSPEAKASARNKRNTPPGKDYKFDTSVFITRKPGESLDSARTRKRREAHSKKRGIKEDKAFDNVVSALRKKHGESGVLTKDSPKPKTVVQPKVKPQKPLSDAERNRREVIARYGGEANYKAGRGLGT